MSASVELDGYAGADYDVAVIGGGLAGLATVDFLQQNGDGLKIALLERSDRLGGMCETVFDHRGFLDMGAQFFGPTHLYVIHYALRFDLAIQLSHFTPTGRWTYIDEAGRPYLIPLFASDQGDLAYPAQKDTDDLIQVLNGLALTVRAMFDDLESCPDASLFDGISVADFVKDVNLAEPLSPATYAWYDDHEPKQNLNPMSRTLLECAMRTTFGAEASDVSMLYFLYVSAAAGSFENIINPAGAQAARLAHGTNLSHPSAAEMPSSDLVNNLLAAIRAGKAPPHIRVGSTVTGIDVQADRVVVGVRHNGTDTRLTAKRVVLAISPTQAASITLTGPPSDTDALDRRRRVQAAMKMGRTLKAFLTFKRPFWREMNHVGTILCAGNVSEWPAVEINDNVWEPELYDYGVPAPVDPYTLAVFIRGEPAQAAWAGRTKAERASALLDELQKAFGHSVDVRAERIASRLDTYYAEQPHDDGTHPVGPCAHFGKGASFHTLAPALRDAIGRLHFAGTESATTWCGYMNGALQSGLRAGQEVLGADTTSASAPTRISTLQGGFDLMKIFAVPTDKRQFALSPFK
jgi:monoamine oxidase